MGPHNSGATLDNGRLFMRTDNGESVELGTIADVTFSAPDTITVDTGYRGNRADHIVRAAPTTATFTVSPTNYAMPIIEEGWTTGTLTAAIDNLIGRNDFYGVDIDRAPRSMDDVWREYFHTRPDNDLIVEDFDTSAIDEYLSSLEVQEG